MMARAPVILFAPSTILKSAATDLGRATDFVGTPEGRVIDYASYSDAAAAPSIREGSASPGPWNRDVPIPPESPSPSPVGTSSSADGPPDPPPVLLSSENEVAPSYPPGDEDLSYGVKFLLFLWAEHFQSVGVAVVLCLLSTLYTLVWRWCFRPAVMEDPGPPPLSPPSSSRNSCRCPSRERGHRGSV